MLARFTNKFQKIMWRMLSPKWRLRSGLLIEINNVAEWVVYNDIFVDGEYDYAISEAIKNSDPQKTFQCLDVGANVGFFTLRFANQFLTAQKGRDFKINLIEGSPQVFNTLIKRLNQKNLNKKVNAICSLVGQKGGSAHIIEANLHMMNALTAKQHRHTASVDFFDLNKLYENNEIIDLLKCDIEGSELSFLENYPDLLKRVNNMVIEFHPKLCDVAKCRELIKKAGFNNPQELRGTPEFSVEFFKKT